MNPKTKTNDAIDKKIYNLLSESRALEDVSRSFWLNNFSVLSPAERKNLVHVLENGDKEMRKEQENHMSRVAEINAKCAGQMTEIKNSNGNLKAMKSDEEENPEDYDPELILKELHDAGEY